MNLKRLIGSLAIAGVIGASTLGIGTGIANANPTVTLRTAVQPVDWRRLSAADGSGDPLRGIRGSGSLALVSWCA